MSSQTLTSARPQAMERGFVISLSNSWHRIGLFAVLALATALNFIGLDKVGYGNSYYAAAVRSMSQNWHAFFFNSLDPTGFVTIDKPPLGFWLQVASVKIFGFNGVALMLPQAIAGVLSVALLYHLVGRIFGRPTGLIAALILATTPISVVASRNNIVDGTLVLAVLLGAWAVSRAVETGKLRWLLLCALFVGLGFNIKMLEAFLVVPAFGLMYLAGARIGWGRRLAYLALTTVVLLVISLSWVTAVDLTPASQRPWVGSTTTNSELDLAIGYNGLQRLTGNSSVGGGSRNAPNGSGGGTARTSAQPGGNGGGAGGGPGGVGENGPTGALRLADTQLAGQIGWLLPLAVIGLLAGAWYTRRRWPLDSRQSALVMWGTWLLTAGVFFSVAGFYHTYYLVMIAPAIAALAAVAIVALWGIYRQSGSKLWPLLPLALVGAAGAQAHFLSQYPAWSRWMTPLILGFAVLGALVLIALRLRPRTGAHAMAAALLVGIAALLVAPAIWSVQSVNASNSGLIPRAGPTGATGTSNGGFGGNGGRQGGPPGQANGTRPAQPPTGNGAFGPPNGGQPPTGGFRPTGGGPPGGSFAGGGGPGGGAGGDQVNKSLVKYLEKNQGTASYLFATTSAGTAEPYIIATGKSVMATGGFTGSDPILTTSSLKALVKKGTVRFFLLGGGGPGGGGPGGGSSATSWVQSNCTAVPSSKYSSSGSSSAGNSRNGSLYDCASAA